MPSSTTATWSSAACATTGATTRSASSRPSARYSASGKVGEFKTMVRTLARRRHRGASSTWSTTTPPRATSSARRCPSAASTTPRTTAWRPASRATTRTSPAAATRSNLQHPRVLQLLMDSLRYWVTEMHVDGFRFDLASALARELHEVDQLSALLRRAAPGPGAVARQADRRALGPRVTAATRSATSRSAGPSGTTATATPCAPTGRATAA